MTIAEVRNNVVNPNRGFEKTNQCSYSQKPKANAGEQSDIEEPEVVWNRLLKT